MVHPCLGSPQRFRQVWLTTGAGSAETKQSTQLSRLWRFNDTPHDR